MTTNTANSDPAFKGIRLHAEDLEDAADGAFELGRAVGIREALAMSPVAQLMLLKRLHSAETA